MGRKLSPTNDEISPELLRELMSKGDQRLLNDTEVEKVKASTVEALRAAGARPALIYAYERTGLLVTSENRRLISASDLDEREDAVAEFGGVALQANDAGDVVGQVALSKTGVLAAARWRVGNLELFRPPKPFYSSSAFRINNHGLAAGYLMENGRSSPSSFGQQLASRW
jgi:hypothetical protein